MDLCKGRILVKCTSHRCVCQTQDSVIFQAETYNAKMTGTGGGKEAKYNNMDLLILDIPGKDNPSAKVWTVMTVLG